VLRIGPDGTQPRRSGLRSGVYPEDSRQSEGLRGGLAARRVSLGASEVITMIISK